MHHLAEHWGDVLTGAGGIIILAYMVNTFPTPKNIYGQWLLGVLKFAVGQWMSAINVMKGQDTMVVAVPRGQGSAATAAASAAAASGSAATSLVDKSSVEVTPESITVTATKQTKTTVPNPNPSSGASAPDSTKEGK